MKNSFTGKNVVVPMVTPFKNDHSVDVEAVEKISEFLVNAGVSVFVIGTTGESESMTAVQREVLLQVTIHKVKNRTKVYAGLTGNCFADMVRDASKYADMGADYLVARCPSFFPPDKSQVFHYLEKLADSVTIPLFLYNIPQTTYLSIPLEIIDKLSYHPNIAGLKDSEKNEERMDEALKLWKHRDDFDYLVGWAAKSAYGLLNGASGIVPSTANICPELYVEMLNAVHTGNPVLTRVFQEKTDLISAIYQKGRSIGQSIAALKALMQWKGLCNQDVLPPLEPVTGEEVKTMISEAELLWNKLNLS